MEEWEGFTEADLKRIENSNSNFNKANNNGSTPKIVKPIARKKANNHLSNKSRTKPTKSGEKPKSPKVAVPNQALFSHSKPVSAMSKSQSVGDSIKPEDTSKSNLMELPAPASKSECIFDDSLIKEKERLKLEDVQQRQRQMEEKNKKKKDMLTKEIAERKKKALAESSKLIKIQQELTKLDQLLNLDVSVIRDKIDEACMEFSLAQKRFNKAESEYIAAKMDLHHKTVIKEDLTEHLFNLIQANEERKAKKLEELMLKLDVEEEELEAKESQRLLKESSNIPNEKSNDVVTANNNNVSPQTAIAEATNHKKLNINEPDKQTSSESPSHAENDSLHGGNC